MGVLDGLTFYGTPYDLQDSNAVRFNKTQTLTDEQKRVARENVSAEEASAVEIVPNVRGYVQATTSATSVEVDANGDPVNESPTAANVRYIVIPMSAGDKITAYVPGAVSTNTRAWMMLGAVDTSTTPHTRPILAKAVTNSETVVHTAPAGTELLVCASTTTHIANNTRRYWLGALTEARATALENGKQDKTVVETVSSATPSITAADNTIYKCGTVTSLTITASAAGLFSVRWTAAQDFTPLLTGITMPEWWTGCESGRVYELSVQDGYGAVMSWATT